MKKLHGVEVTLCPSTEDGQPKFVESPGTRFEMEADLVLLAMGFLHQVHEGMLEELGIVLDQNGNVIVDENYMSSIEGVFSAGDIIMGASLVVRTIHQGRAAARAIDKFLMGEMCLP